MQKFVKTNASTSMNISEEQTTLHPSQVKLVGYLKKKRTKVGGWRKMWFVLQNQLLLSYPSKDDYDKKLVSFKDVLNLVPGTIVRPLGGYRFAIQTTSESVYIFRCDDNKTYLEWITALVESLAIGSSAAKKKDAFGGGVFKKPLHGSYSCSSLVRSKKNKAAVNIPIAHGTARILKRTGLSENDLRAFSSSGCSLRDTNERAHYFCLHENPLLVQSQSNAVTRINRMFCGSASDVELSSVVHADLSDTGLSQQEEATMTPMSSGLKGLQCESDGEICHRSAFSRKMHELFSLMKSEELKVVLDEVVECQVPRYVRSAKNFNCETNLDKECDKQLSKNLDGLAATEGNGPIEDQIQRLSLRGSNDLMRNDSRNTLTEREVNCLRLSTTLGTETKGSSPLSLHERKIEKGGSSLSSDSCTSSEKRNDSPSNSADRTEDTGCNCKDEPIYAVVDLKNKYEHRERIRHEMEIRRKSQTNYLKGLDNVATDYEEVLDFENESFFETKGNSTPSYDEENIYEPINIPESSYSNHKHRNAWWKYISRINIDTLFELGRNRRKAPKSADHTSPFANIRQKFGHHRKSIRIRMIKLYTREQQTPDILDTTAPDANDNKPDQM